MYQKMAQILHASHLNPSAFASYGGVISSNVLTPQTVYVNGGTARRTPEVVPTDNRYDEAPSKKPAKVVLNASLAGPREVSPWSGGTEKEGEEEHGEAKRVFRFKMLEKHPYTTQSFVPMGGDVKYLVVVTDGDEKPNLKGLKAFVARQKQGVCYGVGVWHAPMAVIDEVSG